ncbi:ubiquitin thioesterase otubain-like [Cloeon dipterum]|uniref:ubiquitin thioesterase otubain-like n=1 Tax=Cloeon dipterum TaxID=197152 RepID=UPI0032205AC5
METQAENQTEETVNNKSNVNQDELIIQQQRQIEKEISESTPCVGSKEDLSALESEYAEDQIYLAKAADLKKKYKSVRRTRPDGNCFFRAFSYAYMEQLLDDPTEFKRFHEIAAKSKDDLVDLGFPKFTVEDFHETFMDVLKSAGPSEEELKMEDRISKLHGIFNEQGYSDYVVVYLRLITSGQLQKEAEFYQNFIEGDRGVKDFCHHEVEPMYKESDHIHIIALSSALGVGVRVVYMDRGVESEVIAHDFPDGCQPRVNLLYRPGHYDILYP